MDWYENIPSDEVPPQWMWPFSEEIANWFDDIKEKKQMEMGSDTDSGDTVVPLTKNEDPMVEKYRALRGR